MKKHPVSRVIALVMMLAIAMSVTAAATVRASKYLESYQVTVEAKGSGKMVVGYGVYGTRTMDQLGAQKIVIEVETTPGRWIPIITIDGDSNTDKYYAYNSLFCEGTYTFYGNPGDVYRATLTAYAANGSGSDTGEVESSETVCK